MDHYNSYIAKIVNTFGRGHFAITFGQHVFYSCSKHVVDLYPKWRRHEEHHKVQYARDGFFTFLARYIYYQVRYGYKNNPYEIEAREAELK